MEGFRNHVAVSGEAFRDCVFYAPGIDVHDRHEGAARLPRHGGDEEADCPRANNEGGGARGGKGAVDGVDGDGEGLEEGGCIEGDMGRQSSRMYVLSQPFSGSGQGGSDRGLLVAPDGGMVNPLLQSSLEVRDALRTASEPHLLAEVVPPFPTDAALTAWYAHLERNSVANAEAIDLWPNGNYDTGGFMTKG